MLDVLKAWSGHGRTYDDDARDLAAGVEIEVSAQLADPVAGGPRRPGKLLLRTDGGTFRRRGAEPLPLAHAAVGPPHETRDGRFRSLRVEVGGTAHLLYVPAPDVRLVTEVLSR
jgi:hypothetical protein